MCYKKQLFFLRVFDMPCSRSLAVALFYRCLSFKSVNLYTLLRITVSNLLFVIENIIQLLFLFLFTCCLWLAVAIIYRGPVPRNPFPFISHTIDVLQAGNSQQAINPLDI